MLPALRTSGRSHMLRHSPHSLDDCLSYQKLNPFKGCRVIGNEIGLHPGHIPRQDGIDRGEEMFPLVVAVHGGEGVQGAVELGEAIVEKLGVVRG